MGKAKLRFEYYCINNRQIFLVVELLNKDLIILKMKYLLWKYLKLIAVIEYRIHQKSNQFDLKSVLI